MEQILKNYKEQDRCGTADYIYIEVQERFCVGVIKDGHDVKCPYGDGETKKVYCAGDLVYEDYEELLDDIRADGCGYDENRMILQTLEVEELNFGYIWIPVQFFLTRQGAEEYIRANKHNHKGELRIYVNRFSDRNFEMNKVMDYLVKERKQPLV